MNILPDEYRTGNKKLDEKILQALLKDPVKKNRLQLLTEAVENQTVERLNKYNVAVVEERTTLDGKVFASKKEMERYQYLVRMQRAGMLKNLETQVPFILLDEFTSEQYGKINPITYVADFVYLDQGLNKGLFGRTVVEDAKGFLTDKYRMKKKMFLYRYGKEYAFFEV